MTPSKTAASIPVRALSAILAQPYSLAPQSPPLPDSPRARSGLHVPRPPSASDTIPLQPALRPWFSARSSRRPALQRRKHHPDKSPQPSYNPVFSRDLRFVRSLLSHKLLR